MSVGWRWLLAVALRTTTYVFSPFDIRICTFTDEEEEGRVSLHMPLARDAVAASDASNYRHEVLTAPQAHVKVLSGLCPSFAN